MIRTLLLTGLVCACVAAEEPGWVSAHKAPAGTNEALRARVSGFYQAFVDGKFRKADDYVAEESKDSFFSMEKKPYKAFEVLDLYYTDDFKKAKVVTKVTTQTQNPRFGNMQMQPVVMTYWKFENGTWSWFDPAAAGIHSVDTPFGKMTFGPVTAAGPTILGEKRVSTEEVLQKVSVDKETFRFSPAEGGTETVTVSNGLPGIITVVVEDWPSLPGFTVKADKTKLNEGEKATVTFAYKAGARTPPYLNVNLYIPQTGQRFPIRIDFAETPARSR